MTKPKQLELDAAAPAAPKLVLVDWEAPPGVPRANVALSDFGPSLTRQEFSEECDINAIMERYDQTGVVSHVNQREPMFLDFTVLPGDLAATLETLRLGEEAFMTLPATVRREFDNDAVKFVDFASDKKNLDRMREWGLAPPAKVETPPASPPPAPPAPEAPTQ